MPGHDNVKLSFDHLYGHDRNTFRVMAEHERIAPSIAHAAALRKLRLFLDHYAPPPNVETAHLQHQQRDIAKRFDLFISDVGGGVGHQVAAEQLVSSCEVAIGVDSHTCTVGALGALGLRLPAPAVAQALEQGYVTFDVPSSLRVQLTGRLSPDVDLKDAMLFLALLGPNRFEDHVLEFGGPGLEHLCMADRFTMANFSVDLHARTAIVETDEVTASYLRSAGRAQGYQPLTASPAAYPDIIELDLCRIRPMVAPPPTIFRAVPVSELTGSPRLDVVTIGSCTNGRYEDFALFLSRLSGRHVAVGTRLIATPASRLIYERLLREGLIARLLDAGAVVNPPGCGPCMGLHQGVLEEGEVCLATGSRNSPGRMGSEKADVYLCGPSVAAASAADGYIVDPTLQLS